MSAYMSEAFRLSRWKFMRPTIVEVSAHIHQNLNRREISNPTIAKACHAAYMSAQMSDRLNRRTTQLDPTIRWQRVHDLYCELARRSNADRLPTEVQCRDCCTSKLKAWSREQEHWRSIKADPALLYTEEQLQQQQYNLQLHRQYEALRACMERTAQSRQLVQLITHHLYS